MNAMTPPKIAVERLTVRHGDDVALRDCTLAFAAGGIHAVIGPAGGGKTSLLRALNLLAVELDGAVLEGSIRLDGEEITGWTSADQRAALRRRVGLVFATPTPLPQSIRDNVAFGARVAGADARTLDGLVERSLRAAQLWDEVKDRLDLAALALSGGQQQRLCLARTLALEPDVVLLDEPTSGLDPISTGMIEATLRTLTPRVTVIFVTNNLRQAERVGDTTSFFLMGELIEHGPTRRVFDAPLDERTRGYVAGSFG